MKISYTKDITEEMVEELQAFSNKHNARLEIHLKGFNFVFEPKKEEDNLSQLKFAYDEPSE